MISIFHALNKIPKSLITTNGMKHFLTIAMQVRCVFKHGGFLSWHPASLLLYVGQKHNIYDHYITLLISLKRLHNHGIRICLNIQGVSELWWKDRSLSFWLGNFLWINVGGKILVYIGHFDIWLLKYQKKCFSSKLMYVEKLSDFHI